MALIFEISNGLMARISLTKKVLVTPDCIFTKFTLPTTTCQFYVIFDIKSAINYWLQFSEEFCNIIILRMQ